VYLDHIVVACDRIDRYLAGVSYDAFLANDEKQSAVIRQLEIIGEAAGRLSEAFRRSNTEIPWGRLKALRNVLIHAYADVNVERVWTVAREDAPVLRGVAARLLTRLPGPDKGRASFPPFA